MDLPGLRLLKWQVLSLSALLVLAFLLALWGWVHYERWKGEARVRAAVDQELSKRIDGLEDDLSICRLYVGQLWREQLKQGVASAPPPWETKKGDPDDDDSGATAGAPETP